MIDSQIRLLKFGSFRLNITERLLLRGDEVVLLTPKVFDLLVILAENTGHVLSKEELLRKLWPDSFVEESSLSQNVSLLRKALGEEASHPKYIETVPKRGYRFIADVKEISSDQTHIVLQQGKDETVLIEEESCLPSSSQLLRPTGKRHNAWLQSRHRFKRWKVLTVLAILGLALIGFLGLRRSSRVENTGHGLGIKSMAVLPFKTLGINDELELSGFGMADALIIHLSKLEKPLVLPTSAIYKYLGDKRDAVSIGRELGVDAVLEGTVQRSGQRVRVTAQLIRLSDGKTIWADKFDEEYSNIFNVQDSISLQLSETLLLYVASGVETRTTSQFTQDTEAYQSYLLGLYFWSRGREDMAKALPYFEQAVKQDPNFALAYTYLADCYYYNAAVNGPVASYAESLKMSQENVKKALSLDGNIAEAHTVLAGIKTLEKDYTGAEIEHQLALKLNPNFAIGHNRYGVFLFKRSDLEGAVRELRRGQELDPASRVTNAALANMLLFARKYDEAIKYAKRAVAIDPSYAPGKHALGEAYLLKGNYDDAINQFEEITRSNSTVYASKLAKVGLLIAYAKAGRRAEALKLLPELLRSVKIILPYSLATDYAALGDLDKAFESLEKEKQTPFREATLKFDPFLDPLRSDMRFRKLQQRPIQDD
jgi:DNA-binding winged helix-turn-helix (wHTH) protein/TolB-like protein/Flp pilus assembly protein TadD